jgi:uncharacterized Rmd1/YagE family protein
MTEPLTLFSSNRRLTAHAVLLGERIDTSGVEYVDVLSSAPLTFRVGGGVVTLFRYGVAMMTGLSAAEESQLLTTLRGKVRRVFRQQEEETASIEMSDDRDEQVPPGGPVNLKDLSPERVLVISDALAKSVVLQHIGNALLVQHRVSGASP